MPNVDVLSSAYLEGLLSKEDKPRNHNFNVKLTLEKLATSLTRFDDRKLNQLLDKL